MLTDSESCSEKKKKKKKQASCHKNVTIMYDSECGRHIRSLGEYFTSATSDRPAAPQDTNSNGTTAFGSLAS